jgi:hypothetical protein
MDVMVKVELKIVLMANDLVVAECRDDREWADLLSRVGRPGPGPEEEADALERIARGCKDDDEQLSNGKG